MDTQSIMNLKNDHGVALVEFYASWCPHCRRMMPVVDDVRALFDGRANVYQFDIDDNRDLANELEVESIPTFIIFKNDNEMWRSSGEIDGNVLSEKLQSYL